MKKKLFLFTTSFVFFIGATNVFGATVDQLQSQISEHNQTIQQLQQEITKYQAQLDKTSEEAKSLQGTIQTLDLNAKKLGADLSVTQHKINSTDLTIEQLSQQISEKQHQINTDRLALANILKNINESDSNSLLQTMLVYPNLSTFWGQVETLHQFQTKIDASVVTLKTLQEDLLQNKSLTLVKKNELTGLKNQLSDQKVVVEVNKDQKSKLLVQTKNSEVGYKHLIADRKAKEKAFEDELNAIQAQLKLVIDPKSIPNAATGVLAWPLARHIITQYFGTTEFSQSHAAVYSGHGHNGIDLGAPVGTAIMAAASGTVLGTGDTDTVCPGASFGKWVMIQHTNGLSTLYAHLSVIKASQGQTVTTGETIGYSGMTGYATGPHLHFTVYASQGVKILSRQSKSCGGTYTMPIADLQAYLNPLSYL
jgi:murein DD-endopeptidase MepM/ murein hydrolase activator NlpD